MFLENYLLINLENKINKISYGLASKRNREILLNKKRSKIPLQKCRTYDSSRTKRHRKTYLHI